MSGNIQALIIMMITINHVYSVRKCSESPSHMPELCLSDAMDTVDFKFNINTTIQILDLVDIDEKQRTITLYLYMVIEWVNDCYDLLQSSFNSSSPWLEIPKHEYDNIARPKLLIDHSFEVKLMNAFGMSGFTSLWFHKGNHNYPKFYRNFKFQLKTYPNKY